MDFIDPPTRRKKVQPALSPQEMFELLKNVQNSRDRALISLIIDSGPRITEALTLKKQSIFDGYIVVDGKEGERKIPISEETRLQLLALVNSDGKSDYVFSGQRGHLTSSGAYHIIAKYMRQAHISAPKLGPHRLRHAFGKNYIENGGDLRSLQKIMGHADMKTTQIYVNLAEKAIIAKHHQFTPLRSIQAAAQYTLLDSKEVLMEAEAILKIK
jgi:integrase/recombinase XerD